MNKQAFLWAASPAFVLKLVFGNISYTFGINILKEKHPFVYFTADDKIVAISENAYFFYELITQKTKRMKKYIDLDQSDNYISNSERAGTLENAARHMLDAAEYFIRSDYFSY